jgi:hypothetical protein
MNNLTLFCCTQPEGFDGNKQSVEVCMIYFNDLTHRIFKGLKMHCYFNSNVPTPRYVIDEGIIVMPDFDNFRSKEEYLTCFFHEACHWTGGFARLNRFMRYGYGSLIPFMPYEEIVAEVGSIRISNNVGVEPNIEDSFNFIKAWGHYGNLSRTDISNAVEDGKAAGNYVLSRFLG